LSIADRINNKTTNNLNFGKHSKYPMEYLLQIFKNPFPNIKFNYTSTKEIENIKSLKPTNSHEYDEISAKILKSSSHFVSSPLTYIFNKSLATGIFPSQMKYSIIKPIFKKGDKNSMSNYRPVSLLTSFSKIFDNNNLGQ
jgi:Notch-like protein